LVRLLPISFVSSEEAVVSSAGASVAAAVVSAGAEDCPHPDIAIAAKAIIAVAVITFFFIMFPPLFQLCPR